MAPIDRREHRQQRVRGAGPSSVQASFGFNFGALGARSAKQSSLPPQRSSRRTPVQSTPRGANGSARRHRSASIQRSGSAKPKPTPKDRLVTPQLGKRKRGSSHVKSEPDNDSEDELSPDRDEAVPSVEKSRRAVGAISPIHEELDEGLDELSILDGSANMVKKTFVDAPAVADGTPLSVLAKKRVSSIGPKLNTPGGAPVDEDSEDELSPPQVNGTTPRITAKAPQQQAESRVEDAMDVDELSSPAHPTPRQGATTAINQSAPTTSKVPKRGRPRRAVEEDDEDEGVSAIPKEPAPRSEPRNAIAAKRTAVESTPVTQKPIKKRKQEAILDNEDEDLDELSPEVERTARRSGVNRSRRKDVTEEHDAEDSDAYEEPVLDDALESIRQPVAKRAAPKSTQRPKTSIEKPQHKRPKFSGPKHPISVMRIKGSTVRGITVADTTRTILEESINHRLNRMVEKMQNSSNSAKKKDLRSEINLSISFRESLDEKLLDLQDANDVLNSNFKKMKLLKRDNADLRKEILSLQNAKQEIALEHDDIQAVFDAEKEKIEARSTLSANMFDIEAAIQSGRERARKEGREDEGPHIPLNMLLETVGRQIGSFGGGLLSNVKAFNGTLERAAGWLEGRA